MTATVTVGDSPSSNVSQEPDSSRPTVVAGVLLFVAGATVLMGIITAEALYPAAYNTHTQSVSDLAAMRPSNIVRQPSADIFNLTMIFGGLAISLAAYFLLRAANARRTTVPLAVLGLGMIGVGIFPGNQLAPHTLFSMIAFTAGGIGAILTARMHTGALRLLHTGLGVISLASLAYRRSPVFELDACGTARRRRHRTMGRISRRLVDCHPRGISGRNAENLGLPEGGGQLIARDRAPAGVILHWLPAGRRR
jgi:hypothetical membrane protein